MLSETIQARVTAAGLRLSRLEKADRPMSIVVEGVGAWVDDAYRPALLSAKEKNDIVVTYVNDSSWSNEPLLAWVQEIQRKNNDMAEGEQWEYYLDKARPDDKRDYELMAPDVVFVVTPDYTHCAVVRPWIGRAKLVFVEKPFDVTPEPILNVIALLRDEATAVFGLDHYLFYATALLDNAAVVDSHLQAGIANLEFVLAQKDLIDTQREQALCQGLTLDLLPHGLAFAVLLANLDDVQDILVHDVGVYEPAVSNNKGQLVPMTKFGAHETYSRVSFNIYRASEAKPMIRMTTLVGKGFATTAKYIDISAPDGRLLRMDFGATELEDGLCPAGHLFLGAEVACTSGTSDTIDRYRQTRCLTISSVLQPTPISRDRYLPLVSALVEGRNDELTLALALTTEEAYTLVHVLHTINEAVRRHGLAKYDLHQLKLWE
jgi:predicted dehydrogenase